MKRIILFAATMLAATAACPQKPMTLQQCIDYAVAHNINVKSYANTTQQQRLQLSTSKNSRLPGVSASASQSFNFGRGLNENNNYVNRNTQSTGFNLSAQVELLTGGRIPNQVAADKLNLRAAMADEEHVRQSLELQVTAAYLQAVYASELIKVNASQTRFARVQEARVEKLVNAGKSPESDVVEARSQRAQDEMNETQARCDYRLAMLDLSQLLELPSPDSLQIVPPDTSETAVLPPLPDEIYARALMSKPEVQADKLRVQAAEKSIKVAKAAYYPTLSFGAGLSTSYYKTSGYDAASFSKQMEDNFNKSIGFSLNIPIFNRLSTRNSVRQAKLQHEAQALHLDNTKKTLYKDIQQAYYNALNARSKYTSSLAARDAASANLKVVSGKYENGRANATELEEAKTKYVTSATSCLQAKYEYILRMKIIRFYEGFPRG